MAKGSEFERSICKQLSLWWTENLRDDVFWRTSNSGGRATVRGRKGKKTAGQYGDVCATDQIGQPLLDVMVCELKRGYSKYTVQDLLDAPDHAAVQEYEKWIRQAMTSQMEACSMSWLIVTRRNKRTALVIFPTYLLSALRGQGAFANQPVPIMRLTMDLDDNELDLCIMCLDDFLSGVKPEQIVRLSRAV